MRIGKLAFLVLGLAACSSCMSVGRKIDAEAVNRIEVGKTTRQEVRASIGSPDQELKNGNGDRTYMYMYARSEATPASFIPYIGPLFGDSKSQNQSVTVTFGKDGIVKDVNSTMGGMEAGENLSAGGKARLPETEDNKRAK